MQNITFIILHVNIICIAQSNLVLILKFYTVQVRFQDINKVLNHKTVSSKHVLIFNYENMTSFLNYFTATLRTLLRDAAHISSRKGSTHSLPRIPCAPRITSLSTLGTPLTNNFGQKFLIS